MVLSHPACSPSAPPEPVLPCVQTCYDVHTYCSLVIGLASESIQELFNCSNPYFYSSDLSQCSTLNNTTPLCTPVKPSFIGACQPFNHTLAPHFGAACSPYVSQMIYVQADLPDAISQLDELAYGQGKNKDIFWYLGPVIPIICAQYVLATACTSFFPTCVEVNVTEYNATAVVGLVNCKSFCNHAVFEVCGPFITKAGVGQNVEDLCESFPNSTTFNASIAANLQVTLPCRYDTSDPFPRHPYAPYTQPYFGPCPNGTGLKLHPGLNDAQCGLQCPDASYTLYEWHQLVVITRAGATFSFIFMVILISLYLSKKERRRFPYTLHLNEFIATLFFSGTFMIGALDPEKHIWCNDEGTNATQNTNMYCAFQGITFIFFGIALTSWCTVIAYTVYFLVVVHGQNQDALSMLQDKKRYLYLFGWGIPTIFAAASYLSNKIAYGPPLAWCFFNFTGTDRDDATFSPDYLLFYIPNGVMLVLSFIMFCLTVATIIRVRRTQMKILKSNSAQQIMLHVQIRCLVFIFVIFVIGFTLFEWRLKIQADGKTKNQEGIDWTYCKIAHKLLKDYTGNCAGDVNPARINYPHTVFESVLLSTIGTLIFLAFGSDSSLLTFMGQTITCSKCRKKRIELSKSESKGVIVEL